jgi:hypothetical protein
MKYEYEIVNTHTSAVDGVGEVITKIDYVFEVFNGNELIKSVSASVDLAPPSDEFIQMKDIGHGDLVRFIETASRSNHG